MTPNETLRAAMDDYHTAARDVHGSGNGMTQWQASGDVELLAAIGRGAAHFAKATKDLSSTLTFTNYRPNVSDLVLNILDQLEWTEPEASAVVRAAAEEEMAK